MLNLVEPAVPHLSGGAVVVLNGVTARAPEPDMAAVSAARAATASVTSMLARTLAPGIRVNTVNLGTIRTERQHARHARSGTSLGFAEWEAAEADRRGIPLGRFGTPRRSRRSWRCCCPRSRPMWPVRWSTWPAGWARDVPGDT